MSRSFDYAAMALVALGGSLGVLARAAIVAPVSNSDTEPWVTLAINGVGSLLLGVVVGYLGRRRPRLRAFLGPGVLGGFTTYSAFTVDTAAWFTTPWLAGALVAAALLAGVFGAVVGLSLGRWTVDARTSADARGGDT